MFHLGRGARVLGSRRSAEIRASGLLLVTGLVWLIGPSTLASGQSGREHAENAHDSRFSRAPASRRRARRAPVLRAHGQTLTWTAIARRNAYELMSIRAGKR